MMTPEWSSIDTHDGNLSLNYLRTVFEVVCWYLIFPIHYQYNIIQPDNISYPDIIMMEDWSFFFIPKLGEAI